MDEKLKLRIIWFDDHGAYIEIKNKFRDKALLEDARSKVLRKLRECDLSAFDVVPTFSISCFNDKAVRVKNLSKLGRRALTWYLREIGMDVCTETFSNETKCLLIGLSVVMLFILFLTFVTIANSF